jgi:hypothetical protein
MASVLAQLCLVRDFFVFYRLCPSLRLLRPASLDRRDVDEHIFAANQLFPSHLVAQASTHSIASDAIDRRATGAEAHAPQTSALKYAQPQESRYAIARKTRRSVGRGS